ncbi:MAG: hypothetical protein CMB11_07650 [Euryarchaeota archaeon]|nr:hypothetical protein [Euryarchaeota archaeon]
MQHVAIFNEERYELYYQMFSGLVDGRDEYDEVADVELTRANLLIDVRWPEVSRALADTLCALNEFATSPCYSFRPLASDVARLVHKAAMIAFGTCRHECIPSWFLQNCECLLAATLHKMLVQFSTRSALTETEMQSAFGALLEIAEGLRGFVGLHYLAESTGVHVLMSAVANSRYDFLAKEGVVVRDAERVFADVLAERILADPNRALNVRSAFCFFARSERWQEFTNACLDYDWLKGREGDHLAQLSAVVGIATRDASAHSHNPHGPVHRCSALNTSPERPGRTLSLPRTPTKSTGARIAKHHRRVTRMLVVDTP